MLKNSKVYFAGSTGDERLSLWFLTDGPYFRQAAHPVIFILRLPSVLKVLLVED